MKKFKLSKRIVELKSWLCRKRWALIACFIIAVIGLSSCLIYNNIGKRVSVYKNFTIVIDAGHGGRDGGSVGEGGSVEKDLNLKYAKSLGKILQKAGVKVIMTRTDDNGLYDNSANNKKLSDMRARRDIINKSCPDLVVSIHMNSFPLKNCKGAKTFYQEGNDASFQASKLIQNSLKYYIPNASNTVSAGDYYILNCSSYTSVLVECGFISSPEEEKLLNQDSYREELVYSIYCGIMLYLGFVD